MIILAKPSQQQLAIQLLQGARHAVSATSDLADALELACARVVDRAWRSIIMMIICAVWLEIYGDGREGSAAELVCNLASVLC